MNILLIVLALMAAPECEKLIYEVEINGVISQFLFPEDVVEVIQEIFHRERDENDRRLCETEKEVTLYITSKRATLQELRIAGWCDNDPCERRGCEDVCEEYGGSDECGS